MEKRFERFKGIHPGVILERELNKRSLKQRPFAQLIHEHPQTFNAVIRGKRAMNVPLSLKIDEQLGIEPGTFALLQTYHELAVEAKKSRPRNEPDLSLLRKGLFWDTHIDTIDWDRYYRAVIKRVFERGNEDEKKEIIRFYGEDKVTEVVGKADPTITIPLYLGQFRNR